MALTRGLRNNNPLNIRKSPVRYQGEVEGKDPSFKTFKTMAWGYRAAFAILRTYYRRYKLDTIGKMVGRWAPPSENNTRGYVATVCKRTGIPADKKLGFYKTEMCGIVAAMSFVENGVVADDADVDEGWTMLVGG